MTSRTQYVHRNATYSATASPRIPAIAATPTASAPVSLAAPAVDSDELDPAVELPLPAAEAADPLADDADADADADPEPVAEAVRPVIPPVLPPVLVGGAVINPVPLPAALAALAL